MLQRLAAQPRYTAAAAREHRRVLVPLLLTPITPVPRARRGSPADGLAPRPPGPHQSLVFYTSQCSAVALGERVCVLFIGTLQRIRSGFRFASVCLNRSLLRTKVNWYKVVPERKPAFYEPLPVKPELTSWRAAAESDFESGIHTAWICVPPSLSSP